MRGEDGTGYAQRSPGEMSVLVEWKGIAKYLGKGVRTVQRWELQLGLPVRRVHPERPKARITAVAAEIDAWVKACALQDGASSLPKPEIEDLLQTISQLQSEIQELRRQLGQREAEQS
jgi:hypothetical protein